MVGKCSGYFRWDILYIPSHGSSDTEKSIWDFDVQHKGNVETTVASIRKIDHLDIITVSFAPWCRRLFLAQ